MRMALCIAFGIAFVTAGCDGGVHFDGHVTDPEGNPIQGASVNVVEQEQGAIGYPSDGPPDATTDESGYFNVLEMSAPGRRTFALTVSKEGYEIHREEIESTTAPRHVKIILRPKTE